jgi:hypothetical protein
MHSYLRAENNGAKLWQWFQDNPVHAAAIEDDLGIYIVPGPNVPPQIPTKTDKRIPVVAINSVRPARRVNARGQQSIDLVVEIIQKFNEPDPVTNCIQTHRGGCTILIDMEEERIRYVVRKRVGSGSRIAAEQDFQRMTGDSSSPYFAPQGGEPFAMTHRSA